MKKLTALLLTMCLLLTLTACGGSAAPTANKYASQEMAAEAPAAMDMAVSEEAIEYEMKAESGTGSTQLPENRKWIITVDMTAETEDLDGCLAAVDQRIASLQGYVEDQNVHNGSTYSSRRYRSANLTVRVPAKDVDKFTEEVSGIANVVSQSLRREDITLSYVATESRVKALETEEARLLELMEQAETMADLLEIEARLTDVRYELENRASQLRLYDNQVDYATIYLFIEEVQEYTPVAEKTVWERIRDGFGDSLEGVADGAVDIVVWIIASSPYLLVYGVLIAGAVILVRRIRKGKPMRRKTKKSDPPAES